MNLPQTYDETAHDGLAEYSTKEELVNTITHGLGLLMSLVAAVAISLTWQFLDTGHVVVFGVYVTTLVVVYSISTLSHAVMHPERKHLLRMWDQGTIYFLIAGTYTPFIWSYTASPYNWIALAAIWIYAIIGFYFKVVRQHRVYRFSSFSYIFLGWAPAMVLMFTVPFGCLAWIAGGGLSYTFGTWFLAMRRRFPYCHAVWHLWVIIGSALHFYAVVAFVVLRQAAV